MGFVYLLWEKGSSCYKVGKAKSKNKLAETRNTYNPEKLSIVGLLESENYAELEKKMLDRWKNYKKSGEWLDVPPSELHRLLYDFNSLPSDVVDMLVDAFNLGAHYAFSVATDNKFDGCLSGFEFLDKNICLKDSYIKEIEKRNHLMRHFFEGYAYLKSIRESSNIPCH